MGVLAEALATSLSVFWRLELDRRRLLLSPSARRLWSASAFPDTASALLRLLSASDRSALLRALRDLINDPGEELRLITRFVSEAEEEAHVVEVRGRRTRDGRAFVGAAVDTDHVFANDILASLPTPVFVKDEARRRTVSRVLGRTGS